MNLPSQRDAAANELPPVSAPACRSGGTWWSRNWVRVLVVGTGGAVVLFFAGIAFIVVGAFAVIRSSGACQEAMARAGASPAVLQALGAPLEVGWFVTGTLDPGRSADITIPVTGPRGTARIHVVASKATGKWVFSTLTVKLRATGGQISLVEAAGKLDAGAQPKGPD
jgi:hypothetical protein